MLLRRVEIGVAADGDRKLHARFSHRHQRPRAQRGVVAQLDAIVTQELADPRPCRAPCRRAKRDERVELRAIEHALACGRNGEQPRVFQRREIEHELADRDAGARARVV